MRGSPIARIVAVLLTTAAPAADLKTKGVSFTAEPAPKPNQFGHRTAYVEDPSGARIEPVEHAQCAAGHASRESR